MKKFISVMSSLCLAATSLFSAFPAMSVSADVPTDTKPATATGTLQFDVLPSEQSNEKSYTVGYDSASGLNTIEAEPGEEILVGLYASEEPACAAQMVILDFSEVEYVAEASYMADAYSGTVPTVNDLYANTDDALGQQYVSVVWAATQDLKSLNTHTVSEFDIKVPDEKPNGSDLVYTIKETTARVKTKDKEGNEVERERSISVIGDPDIEIPAKLYGLQIIVRADSTATTSSDPITTTTSSKQSDPIVTTTASSQGGGQQGSEGEYKLPDDAKPAIPDGTLRFELVPASEDYNEKTYEVGYDAKAGKNTIIAEPGQEIGIALTASSTPACAAQMIVMDFSQVIYTEGYDWAAEAYSGVAPTINDLYANTEDSLGQKYVSVVWAATADINAEEGKPIAVFMIKVPSAEATDKNLVYTIDQTTAQVATKDKDGNEVIRERSLSVIGDPDIVIPAELIGLQIVVPTAVASTTTTPKTTTTTPKASTTTTPVTTTTASSESSPVTTTTPKVTSPAGTAEWAIASTTVSAGAKVSLPVTAKSAGASGFVLDIDYAAGLTLDSIEWANGFKGDIVVNKDDVIIVWADNTGVDQALAASTKILDLNFTAPTAAGDYAVTFKELTVENTDGNELTVSKTDGMITVEAAATTTTVSEPIPGGDAEWVIGTTTVAAGAKVELPVTAKGEGTSGFVLDIDYDAALKLDSITWADGYKGDVVINKNDVIIVWADNTGLDQTLADAATILTLNFTAPDAAGDYPVTFKELVVQNTDGSELTVKKTDGMITVEAPTTTTTTVSEPISGGDAEWVIGTTTVAAGAKVELPVTAKGEGTSGFVLDIDYDAALKLDSITWADGYKGDVVINKNDVIIVWADNTGLDQTLADATTVLTLNFTAPDAAGDYPVTFKELVVQNTDGSELTVTKKDGMITILGDTTTTSEPKVTTTSEPVVTTTSEPKVTTTSEPKVTTTSEPKVTTTSEPKVTTTSEPKVTTTSEPKVTTTSEPIVTTTLAPGTVGWYIASTTAQKGEQNVTVPVTVKNDPGTAGFVVDFAYDIDNLTLAGIEWANGYTGDALINKDQLIVVWGSENGLNQTAAEGAVVLNLIFNVNDDATTGKHPVTFETIIVQNTDQNDVTVVTVDGYIEIPDDVVTTTSEPKVTTTSEPKVTTTSEPKVTTTSEPKVTTTSEPKVTTTSEPKVTTTSEPKITTTSSKDSDPTVTTTTREPIVNPGHVVYYIGNVQGEPGETVKVPVSVVYDLGTAGFTMEFTVPDGFQIVGVTYGDAYEDTDEYMWNASDYILVWNSPDGLDRIAADNSVIAYLEIQIPDNAQQDTVYPVEFGTVTAENTDGSDLTPSLIPGSIYIKKVETTSEPKVTTTSEPVVTTTTTQTTPIPDPGHVVLNVGDDTAAPGEQAEIPITVWFDDGTAEFTFKIDIPDGLTIDDVVFDPVYEENGTFTYDPETGTVTWKRNDDSDFVPTPGQELAVIKITVPEDAEPGTEYPINLTDLTALDENGNPLEATVLPGTLTAGNKEITTTVTTTTGGGQPTTSTTTTTTGGGEPSTTSTTTTTGGGDQPTTSSTTATTTTGGEPVTVTTTSSGEYRYVTSYVTSFEAPTRVNYWSHDYRTFKESGGLKDLKASITLYKFYIDDNDNFVNAEGTVLSNVKYTEGGALPVDAAFEVKTADVTGITKPEADADSPMEIWENELKAQFGDAYVAPSDNLTEEQKSTRRQQLDNSTHENKHTVPCYYFPTEQNDPDFIFDGEPIYFGEFQIFIGVKGDYDLNNKVDAADAQLTLTYFGQTMVGNPVVMSANEEYDHSLETGKQEDGLIFYLVNVQYRQKGADSPLEDPPTIMASDSQCILNYFAYNYVTLIDRTWEEIVGYDLLDSFYGDPIE